MQCSKKRKKKKKRNLDHREVSHISLIVTHLDLGHRMRATHISVLDRPGREGHFVIRQLFISLNLLVWVREHQFITKYMAKS